MMDNPIPRGPEKLYCPLWRKPMCKVCHTCPMWMHLRGKNPNTGADIDRWSCALAQLPIMLVENAKETRSAAAEIVELRKEQTAQHDEMKKYSSANLYRQGRIIDALTQIAPTPAPTPLIEHKEPKDEDR